MDILKSTNLLEINIVAISHSGATCSEQLQHEHYKYIDDNAALFWGTEHLI